MIDGPPSAALDLDELLLTLHRHAVQYTVIGGVAVQVHGHRRTTKDLDVIADPDLENLARLSAALVELEPGRATSPARGLRPPSSSPPQRSCSR